MQALPVSPSAPFPCVAGIECRASRVAPSFDCIDHGTSSELVLELTASFHDMTISRAFGEVITDAEDGSLRWLRIKGKQHMGQLWTKDMKKTLFTAVLRDRRAATKRHHGLAAGDPLSDEASKKASGNGGQKGSGGPAAGERAPRRARENGYEADVVGILDEFGRDPLMIDVLDEAPPPAAPVEEPWDPEAYFEEPDEAMVYEDDDLFGAGMDSDDAKFEECFKHDWAPDGIDDGCYMELAPLLADDAEGKM